MKQVRVVGAGFNSSAASDLAVALQTALSGLHGALLNVEINLRYLPDDAGGALRERAVELGDPADRLVAETWPQLRALVIDAE